METKAAQSTFTVVQGATCVIHQTALKTSKMATVGTYGTRPTWLKGKTYAGAKYYIPLAEIPEKDLETIKEKCEIHTKETEFKKQPPLVLWGQEKHFLTLPRMTGLRFFGPPDQDATSQGEALDESVTFTGTLKPEKHQPEACAQILDLARKEATTSNGFLNLPCGFGKTVCLCYLIGALGRKAIIYVSSGPQMDAAVKSVKRFLPNARLGIVQQKRVEVDDVDVVVAMVQTVLAGSQRVTRADLKKFGVSFVDEAHHMAADWLSRLMTEFVFSKHVYGLSATIQRKDGRTEALYHLFGPVLYSHVREGMDLDIQQILVPSGDREEKTMKYKPGQPDWVGMLTELAEDPRRVLVGVHCIKQALEEDTEHRRRVLAVSGRKTEMAMIICFLQKLYDHLKWLNIGDLFYLGFENLPDPLPETLEEKCALLHEGHASLSIGTLKGGMTQEQRDLLPYCNVTVSIENLGKESLDVPDLDTAVWFLNMTKGPALEQIAGRVQRGEARNPPKIYDLVDSYSMFLAVSWGRNHALKKKGYTVVRKELLRYPTLLEQDVPETICLPWKAKRKALATKTSLKKQKT